MPVSMPKQHGFPWIRWPRFFERDKSTVSRHIRNVFEEGELNPEATVAKIATVQKEGERTVERLIDYYNLDVVQN